MNLKTTILFVIGMSISFSVILGVLVTSRHRAAPHHERLPVLRAPTAAQVASARKREAQRTRSGQGSVVTRPNYQASNELHLLNNDPDGFDYDGSEWSVDRLESEKKTEPALATFKPSKHLDRVQAELMKQVQVLRESRNLMLSELAAQLQKMTVAQAAAELESLDDESASIALAKLSKEKRDAVLQVIGDQRARTLGRLAKIFAAKNREG